MHHSARVAPVPFVLRGKATHLRRVPRAFRQALCFFVVGGLSGCVRDDPEQAFQIVEASIPAMQEAMEEGRLTSRELVEAHLVRIALHEEEVNGVIAVNSNALAEADRLDRERAEGRVRGPLHGIPIALKDNIHTTDMPTTGGALAFADFVPPYEATLTENLRAAGAVILAKTGMSELAGMVGRMPPHYSAVGGHGMNPYDRRRDPREGQRDGRSVLSPYGSSSGIGTAMSFWAASVGTETSGSILGPSNAKMLVGVKPTVGRVSRWGVIPLSLDQDTPGPMARTVTDAAIMLGALEGAGPDPADPATTTCSVPPRGDYTAFLNPDGLVGARIGVPRAFFYDSVQVPGSDEWEGGISEAKRAAMDSAIAILEEQGAIIIDPVTIPSTVSPDPEQNFLTGPGGANLVYTFGMKRDFNAWLETLGETRPVASLTELREWNLAHQDVGAIRYGQYWLDQSDTVDLEMDRSAYERDLAWGHRVSTEQGIDVAMEEHELDALFFPGRAGGTWRPMRDIPRSSCPSRLSPSSRAHHYPRGLSRTPNLSGYRSPRWRAANHDS